MDKVYDARIRNPVPTKLKGKTVAANGNFSVMVVSLAPEASARDRHSAAKRSSEDTVKAAKLANTDGYVPVAKSRAPVSSTPPGPSKLSPPDWRGSFLDNNTKTEQARLLTLLRSLPPVLVFDQLCRALDFFGSEQRVPTHLTEDGFPDSAVGNGPGALIVSWMSEIFPGIDVVPTTTVTAHADAITARTHPQHRLSTAGQLPPEGTDTANRPAATPLWPDTAAPSSAADRGKNEAGGGREYAAHTMQATNNGQINERPPMTESGDTSHVLPDEVDARDATPKRRRGRPKGWRNKPRIITNPVTIVIGPKRRGRGRPKGSKNKSKCPEDPPAARYNSLSAADADGGPGQVASNQSGTQELALGIGDESPDGRTEDTPTMSGLNPRYQADSRYPREGSLDRMDRNSIRPLTSLDESRLVVFDRMTADVPPGSMLLDSTIPLSYKRRRLNPSQDQSQSRQTLGSHEGQGFEGHAGPRPGSQRQYMFPGHRETTLGLYFEAPLDMDLSDAWSGLIAEG